MIVKNLSELKWDTHPFKETKVSLFPANVKLENILFLDVETTSKKAQLSELNERKQQLWEKKANRFMKYESKEDYASTTIEELYVEKAALFPEYGQIVCVSIGFLKGQDFKKLSFIGNEKDILTNLIKAVQLIQSTAKIRFTHVCTCNGKFFDMPYLNRRAMHQGLLLPYFIYSANAKPWEQTHIDLIEFWRSGANLGDNTFDSICEMLGVESPKGEIDGSKVGTTFWQENDIIKIALYCEQDITKLFECVQKLFNLNQITL